MEEPLVKPEQDLEKVRYLFGPIRDADIEVLRGEAAEAARQAKRCPRRSAARKRSPTRKRSPQRPQPLILA